MINPNKSHKLQGIVTALPKSFNYLGSMVIQGPENTTFEAFGFRVVGQRPGRFKLGDKVEFYVNWSIMSDSWYVNHVVKKRAVAK